MFEKPVLIQEAGVGEFTIAVGALISRRRYRQYWYGL
jgi:hypothetical protein